MFVGFRAAACKALEGKAPSGGPEPPTPGRRLLAEVTADRIDGGKLTVVAVIADLDAAEPAEDRLALRPRIHGRGTGPY